MLTLPRTITITVKQVLHHLGVDLDTQATNGITAAMLACSKGHIESMKLLHDMKADLNVRTKRGETALHYAAADGHAETRKVMSRQ